MGGGGFILQMDCGNLGSEGVVLYDIGCMAFFTIHEGLFTFSFVLVILGAYRLIFILFLFFFEIIYGSGLEYSIIKNTLKKKHPSTPRCSSELMRWLG